MLCRQTLIRNLSAHKNYPKFRFRPVFSNTSRSFGVASSSFHKLKVLFFQDFYTRTKNNTKIIMPYSIPGLHFAAFNVQPEKAYHSEECVIVYMTNPKGKLYSVTVPKNAKGEVRTLKLFKRLTLY